MYLYNCLLKSNLTFFKNFRIVLDESVIPKRYARVLLHAIYLDTVDLSLILRGSGCGSSAGSLSEVNIIVICFEYLQILRISIYLG